MPLDQTFRAHPLGKAEVVRPGKDGVILAIGYMVYPACEAAKIMAAEGIDLAVVNARFIKPLDRELILSFARDMGRIFTVEENVLMGGFGSAVLELLEEEGVEGTQVTRFGYPDQFIEQGEQAELRKMYGLDSEGIAAGIRKALARQS